MSLALEPMKASDWEEVRAIYADGIATGMATFETEPPDWESWNADHLSACRLVAVEAGQILGWAGLSPVSDRCAYAGVAEVSIYVRADRRGRGVGNALLKALVAASERAGIWTLQAGMFGDNAASIALHEACGFRAVGVRERLGKLDGVWRDVLLMERRSDVTGMD